MGGNIETHTQNHRSDEPALLTIKEAAEKLRISRAKLYDLIRSRRLATVQIGRRRLITATALAALVQQLQQESMA
ncbi:helix-turn-helix domain-containing protein [Streptomyces sp. NPDC048385]|uniref:helix-turn-helix domain-containing protein n=1 Tax=Streptomyces sp. NPDC048385 TaxID=3155145 RepID=UPI0034172345